MSLRTPTTRETTRRDVAGLFRALNVLGIRTRMGYKCCSGCASAAAASDFPGGAEIAYFHAQDEEAFDRVRGHGPVRERKRSYRRLKRPLMIRYGVVESSGGGEADARVARKIMLAAAKLGLPASWNCDPESCIELAPSTSTPALDPAARRNLDADARNSWTGKAVCWGEFSGSFPFDGTVSRVTESGVFIVVHGRVFRSSGPRASGIVHRQIGDLRFNGAAERATDARREP